VYILSIVNFLIILSPLLFFIVPFIVANSDYINSNSVTTLILLALFITSCITVLAIICDFLFGFSTRFFVKNTKEFHKIKNYDVMERVFDDVKLQFNQPNVKLLISNSSEVNAFAIGNMGKQYIVLTMGIVSQYLIGSKDREDFLQQIKGIMGHEMSHLINKDYLPGLLLKMNEIATDCLSRIILIFFQFVINVLQIIPVAGRGFAAIVLYVHKIFDFFISFSYKYILLPIYNLIQLKISRVREFRCDAQSAMAVGGKTMAKALEALGESGYTTIFSTHPKTADRIKHVKNISGSGYIIRPDRFNTIINFLFVLFLLLLPLLLCSYINFTDLADKYDSVLSRILFRVHSFSLRIRYFIHDLKQSLM